MAVATARGRTGPIARLSTETKQAFKTTEFWMTLVYPICKWDRSRVQSAIRGGVA